MHLFMIVIGKFDLGNSVREANLTFFLYKIGWKLFRLRRLYHNILQTINKFNVKNIWCNEAETDNFPRP